MRELPTKAQTLEEKSKTDEALRLKNHTHTQATNTWNHNNYRLGQTTGSQADTNLQSSRV